MRAVMSVLVSCQLLDKRKKREKKKKKKKTMYSVKYFLKGGEDS